MKTTITIKRPGGIIETIDISDKFPGGLTDGMFASIKKATAEAGKGECVGYETKETPLSAEEMAEVKAHDDKCRWFVKHGFNADDVS